MTENAIQIERQSAPHGPEEPYTPEEIRHSMQVHGSDLLDMMVQQPDIYWGLAWERAEELVGRDLARAAARHAEERKQAQIGDATELRQTRAGTVVAWLKYHGQDWYPPAPTGEAS